MEYSYLLHKNSSEAFRSNINAIRNASNNVTTAKQESYPWLPKKLWCNRHWLLLNPRMNVFLALCSSPCRNSSSIVMPTSYFDWNYCLGDFGYFGVYVNLSIWLYILSSLCWLAWHQLGCAATFSMVTE